MTIYSCEICNKKFNNVVGLSNHKRIHKIQKPIQIQQKTNYYCFICDIYFDGYRGLTNHSRTHNKPPEEICCHILTKEEILVKDLDKYDNKVVKCEYCETYIHNKRFCNQSCSMKYFNTKPKTDEIKSKISKTLNKFKD